MKKCRENFSVLDANFFKVCGRKAGWSLKIGIGIFFKKISWSECRESNSDCTHPMGAYCHYTTLRLYGFAEKFISIKIALYKDDFNIKNKYYKALKLSLVDGSDAFYASLNLYSTSKSDRLKICFLSFCGGWVIFCSADFIGKHCSLHWSFFTDCAMSCHGYLAYSL